MEIRINKVGSAKFINSLANGHRYKNGLLKTYEAHLFLKKLLFLVSILIGLNKLAVAQTTTTNSIKLTNFADKSQATQGQTITHTLVVTNTGTTTVSNVLVRDSISTGLRYIPNTSSTPPGTTFTAGVPINTWAVPSLSAGQSLSLTYQAVADSSGVLYSIATIPSDTAASCTSIPVRVCEGDTYLFQLSGPAGRTNYRWYKDGTEITDQTTRVLNVTAPGSYSLAINGTAGKCPDFSLCPFIIEKYALPAFQLSALSASCSGSTSQADGKLKLTGFNAGDTYQYSEGTSFNPSASLSGAPNAIPGDGVIVSNLPNPTANKAYTVRVYNASGCYVEKTVTLLPSACCSLAATATPGACNVSTNTFSNTVTVTLVNPSAGILTITDGPLSQTIATTGSTTLSAVFTTIPSDGNAHTVTASLSGCSTVSATYTAPASCSVAPAQPTLAVSVTPGTCAPANNHYTLSGTISLSAAVASTLTLTDGSTSTTLAINAGQTTTSFTLDGLNSGTGSHNLTVSGTGYATVSATYTAPASCSVAPAQPTLAISVTPGTCAPANNHYTLSGTISLSAAVASTLTLADGPNSTTLAISAGQTNASFMLDGLLSGTGSHTLTVSGTGYTTASATYTAPASCSVAPAQPTLVVSVTPSACAPANNHYTLSGTISLSAAVATTLTLADGPTSTTLAITAGQTTASFTLDGLNSGTGSRTLTVSGAGYTQTTATYSAPASCSVAQAQPTLAVSVTPGTCAPADNHYAISGTISLSAAVASVLTLSDGPISTTVAVSAGQTTASFMLDGFLSGTGSRTLTVSGAGYTQTTATYTAPASCSVAPAQPTLAVSVTPGACTPANNHYTLSGTISLSAAVATTLTLTDGTNSTTLAITARQTTASFTLDGLNSGTGSRTLTVSGAGYTTASATYSAPASCSIAPAQPTLAVSVTPGTCAPADNHYAISGTISLSAAVASVLTLSDGPTSTTLAITAGQTTASFMLDGLLSGTGSHTLTVSGTGYTTASATYTAPASCSVASAQPTLAVSVTPGACAPANNHYTLSGTISLSAAVATTLTLADGPTSTTLAITAGQTTASFMLDGLLSGTGSHTLTVSGSGYTQTTATYTAPASCSVAPAQPTLAVSVTPGACAPANNHYTLSGTISLSAAVATTLTLTDGTTSTTLAVSAGQTTASFTLDGLSSGTGSRTLTVSGAGYTTASATYSAPASCSVAPAQPTLAVSVTPGACAPANNHYTLSGTISLSAAVASTLTITDGPSSTTLAVSAGQTTASFTLDGLSSGTGSHTLTVSGTGYTQTTATYSAPASCSVAQAQPTLALSVTPGACTPANNHYAISGTISLSAAVASVLTLSDGPISTTLAVSAGQTTASFMLDGFLSGTGSRTLTVSGTGYTTASATYTAPASCSVAPAQPRLAVSVTPGTCVPTDNHYTISGTISLSAAVATTLTLADGTTSTTLAVSAGQTTASFMLDGLNSGTGSHTLTVSGTGYTTVSAAYTAPTSCSVAPTQPTLAVSATPGACAPANNHYALSGTISLSAAVSTTLTLADGTNSTTLAITAGQTTASFMLDGLLSGTGSRTLTVSGAGYTQTTATYSAPASCSVAPAQPTLTVSVTPGTCVPTDNHYTISGTISLSAAVSTTLTLADGPTSTTLAITAGQTTASFTLDGLNSGTGSHTLTVSGAGYATVSATYSAPTSCSVAPAQPTLTASVTPGACAPANNHYTLSGTISLSAAVVTTLTITDGPSSTTLAVSAGQTTASFTLDGLSSGTGSRTLTVSGAGYTTASATYSAPASCSVAPAQPTLAVSVTPGTCAPADNHYTLSGTISLSAAVASVLTLSDGPTSTTLAITAGQTTASFMLDGLNSGTGSHTLTVSGAGYTQTTATYTAPASCSVAPAQPTLAVSVTPGTCVPTDNHYTISGTISLSAAVASTLTITDGTTSTTLAVSAGQTTASFMLDGLLSGTGSHTLTVSGTGYTTASATYTAPTSCSVAPAQPTMAISVTPGACAPANNHYTLSGTISLSAAVATTLTLTDGPISTTLAVSAGQTTASFMLDGLLSGTGSHTLTVSGAGYTQTTASYTAPASCSVAPAQPTLAVSVTPGACTPANNHYALSGTISLSAAVATTLTLTDGPISTTLTISAGQTTASFMLDGLNSGTGSHNLTVSGTGYATVSATYTAPASCSVAPAQPTLAISVTPGTCAPANNHYAISGTISLSAAVASTLTLTDGTTSTTVAVSAGQTTASFTLDGLSSGTGSRTLTVSGAGYTQTTATYTAPASCSVAPAQPTLALSVTPGACAPANNHYAISGTISLSAAVATTLTLTDGPISTTLAITARQTTASFMLDGLISGTGSRTLTVSGTGYTTASATYTAPASCSVAPAQPALALSVTPGACAPANNHYTLSGTISLSAAVATTLTIADGPTSTTLAVSAGQSTASFMLDGLNSGTGSHTLTVSGTGYTTVLATYSAPTSCSVAPAQPTLALSVTPSACAPANNHYTLSGTISLSAAVASVLTLSDGPTSTTLAISAGQSTTSFTLDGLNSGTGSRTLTVSGAGYTTVSATYSAPASCSVAPAQPVLTLGVTDPGICNPASNLYTSTGIITLANAPAGIATITDGTITTSIAISAGATSVPYSLTGLLSGSGVHRVTVSFVSQTASTTYIAPESCFVISPAPAILTLTQVVDKSKAKIGELVSYTIVLTNTGASSSTATTVQLPKAAGLIYVANSATPPAGTVFSPGLLFSKWTVSSLSAGQSIRLTFQAKADSSGIFQNMAMIPGDTAVACTSVPAQVCAGENYLFKISAAPGLSQYKWFRTFQGVTTELTSFTTNVLTITQPGEYKLNVDGQVGNCPNFSCCPFIVEEDSLPSLQAKALPVSCVGGTAQTNGQLVIQGFKPTHTYQYSRGTTFDQVASLSGGAKVIPAGGIIANTLDNPTAAQAYTIRVYNESGCHQDITVLLTPTTCACTTVSCTPFVISETKRVKRSSDLR